MGLIIDIRTKEVINLPMKQSEFVKISDVGLTFLRMSLIVTLLGFRFDLM